MKKLLFLTIMILLICSFVFAEVNEPFERCSPDDFSIMPWGWSISEGDKGDYDSFYKDIYDCGFNLGGFASIESLPMAKKNNIKATISVWDLVDDGEGNISLGDTQKKAENWAEKIKAKVGEENLSQVFQVYVKDEPWLKDAKWVSHYANAVKNIVGCRPYVNMMPDYAEPVVLGGPYEEYLDKFLTECPLDYISYDNYSLFVGTGLDEDRFYSNIESIRKVALKHNVRFVNIILSIAHFNYAMPNDYSIHVQGWSTLAYGGRGLSYFLFHNANLGNYRGCAYDKYGNKTELWYVIQNMNFAIHNIMPYYKGLTSINVFHKGYVPKNCNGEDTAQLIEKLDLRFGFLSKPVEKKPNVLVGEFKDKTGKPYAIIVNKDSEYSVNVFNLKFKDCDKVMRIADTSFKNPKREFNGEDKWIAPGHGILLCGE